MGVAGCRRQHKPLTDNSLSRVLPTFQPLYKQQCAATLSHPISSPSCSQYYTPVRHNSAVLLRGSMRSIGNRQCWRSKTVTASVQHLDTYVQHTKPWPSTPVGVTQADAACAAPHNLFTKMGCPQHHWPTNRRRPGQEGRTRDVCAQKHHRLTDYISQEECVEYHQPSAAVHQMLCLLSVVISMAAACASACHLAGVAAAAVDQPNNNRGGRPQAQWGVGPRNKKTSERHTSRHQAGWKKTQNSIQLGGVSFTSQTNAQLALLCCMLS